ncbi:MAG: molybdopterin-dependent oxidoreductase [Deferribacteraceae bacterium]|nr:molybdopterin-dependent oxidoreductase [Deferribacteraceae bacterium]
MLNLSRRHFIKTTAAFAAAAAIGCKTNTEELAAPRSPNDPLNIATTAPHNCGGACALRAVVQNGVIKRILTDESKADENMIDVLYYGGKGKAVDAPQERACVRCHAQKAWIYDSNRLLYPLKQTKERGDLSGFVRISWDEATQIIKDKIETNRAQYGFGAFHALYASGSSGPRANLSAYSGGGMGYRQDYSFPSLHHVTQFMLGEGYIPRGNSRADGVNAEEIICWSHNVGETFWGTNSMWYLTQFKEQGTRIKVVDQRVSQTAAAIISNMENDYMAPASGTDTAVMAAMIHSMLRDHYEDLKKLWGVSTDAELKAKVGQYIHGFFDDREASSYNPAIDDATFKRNFTAKNGTSLSAYIFGPSNYLVRMGLNDAPSAYPETIGYNVWAFSDRRDLPAANVRTSCYGQVEKTPEWAERISGVPASQIRAWAKDLLTKKTSRWLGGGFQRNSESEQPVMMMLSMMGIARCFGEPGRACGWYINGRGTDALAGNTWSPNIAAKDYLKAEELSKFYSNNTEAEFPYVNPDTLGLDYAALNFYDTSRLSFPNQTNTFCRTQIPVFTWLDAVEATNSPKVRDQDGSEVWPSRWNDGQIKRLPVPWKVIINGGGNVLVNQNGDTNHAVEVLKDRTKLDFILTFDVVMTASAQYSDLVLPSAMGAETVYDTAPFWENSDASMGIKAGSSKYLIANKAVDAPGEAISALQFQALVAKAFGREADYFNGAGDITNFEENIVKANYEANPERVARMSFDEWREKGVYRPDVAKYPNKIWGEAFLQNPATNPLPTISGRIEAYCLSMMEDYEARHYNNIDTRVYMRRGTTITTAATPPVYASRGRFVYPIAMYIPLIEGKHADNSHPDVLRLERRGYDKLMHTWHIMYRSHSTFNSNPLLNDFYKRDAEGNFAHMKREITNANETSSAPMVWHDGVYEAVWVNPNTAYSGTTIRMQEGDIVILESLRGRVKAVVHTTERVRRDVIMIGQGSWYSPDENGIDIGGCANTLMSQRPSRIGQGMTLANDCRVRVYRA